MINIEEIEKQINKTEDYLRSNQEIVVNTSLRRSTLPRPATNEGIVTSNSNPSKAIQSENPLASSNAELPAAEKSSSRVEEVGNASISSSNRYSDPQERELLIQQLLSDYNTRKERRKAGTYFDIPDSEDLTASRHSLPSLKKSFDPKEKKVEFSQSTIRFSARNATYPEDIEEEADDGVSNISVDTLASSPMSTEAKAVERGREKENTLFFASDILTSSMEIPETQERSFEGYNWSLPPPPLPTAPSPLPSTMTSSVPTQQGKPANETVPSAHKKTVSGNQATLKTRKQSHSPDLEHSNVLSSKRAAFRSQSPAGRPPRSQSTERGRSRFPIDVSVKTKNNSASRSVERKGQSPRTHSVDSSAHRTTKERLEQEAEAEFKRLHPFKPTLSTNPTTSSSVPTFHNVRQSTTTHFFDRLSEMSEEYKQKLRQKEKIKSELEKMEMLQCTFQPEITRQSKQLLAKKEKQRKTNTSYDDFIEQEELKQENQLDSFSNRLFQEAALKAKRNHYLSKYMGELSEWDCTFQPTINSNTDKILYKSFQQQLPPEERQGRRQQRPSSSPSQSPRRQASTSPVKRGKQPLPAPTSPSSPSKQPFYTPIHQRVTELQRQKQRHLRELKQSIEQEQSNVLTFQPNITSTSKQLAKKKFQKQGYSYPLSFEGNNKPEKGKGREEEEDFLIKSDVASRLLNEGRKLARRKQELLYQREQELAIALEQPVMSIGSKKLVNGNENLRDDFAQRQRYYEIKSNQQQDQIYHQEAVKYAHYFQPDITQSKSVQILKQKKPEHLLETPSEKFERLSTIDAEALQEKKQLLFKKYYNSIHYPFQPEINYISKLFGKKNSIQDLYENTAAKQSQQILLKQLEEERNEECTFQPKINSHSKQLVERSSMLLEDEYEKFYQEYYRAKGFDEQEGGGGSGEEEGKERRGGGGGGGGGSVVSTSSSKKGRINFHEPEKMFQEIQLHQLQKENRRKDELIAREIVELQECTFQPMLQQNQSFLYDQGASATANEPIIIKGLNRHLELKQLSDRLKKEEQEREFNAFHVKNVDKFRRQEDGSTIVQVSQILRLLPSYPSDSLIHSSVGRLFCLFAMMIDSRLICESILRGG